MFLLVSGLKLQLQEEFPVGAARLKLQQSDIQVVTEHTMESYDKQLISERYRSLSQEEGLFMLLLLLPSRVSSGS